MTASYGPLAAWYDALTRDVDYAAFADFYERQFQSAGGEMRTLLDLCCGTGTLTCLLAERGYEMIAADASYDMLMQAREKAAALPSECVPPLLLCQSAEELDLYGTVDAAVCSLDGFDYLPPEHLPEVLHRLHLFIRPGGLLIFDIRTPASFAALDGEVFLDETEDVPRRRTCSASGARNSQRASCALAWISSSEREISGRVNPRSTWNTSTRPNCSPTSCSSRASARSALQRTVLKEIRADCSLSQRAFDALKENS